MIILIAFSPDWTLNYLIPQSYKLNIIFLKDWFISSKLLYFVDSNCIKILFKLIYFPVSTLKNFFGVNSLIIDCISLFLIRLIVEFKDSFEFLEILFWILFLLCNYSVDKALYSVEEGLLFLL